MIRKCNESDIETIYDIINDAAIAYKNVIPQDRWHFPYMPKEEVVEAIQSGVMFYGYENENQLIGIMGIQEKEDATLIRHAYVRTTARKTGIGSALLKHLAAKARSKILVGTWAAAVWAIRFYEKNGFRLVAEQEKNRLLKKYWNISERQIETSVVLEEKKTTGFY